MEPDQVKHSLEVWKTTIAVQQHFNDIELKIRNYALTVLVAVLGASAVAVQEDASVTVGGVTTPLATWLLVAGIIVWLAFYFVDQIWYHRLLIGAVTHATELEKLLDAEVPGVGLTQAVSKASPYKLPCGLTLHTKHKMKIVYYSIALLLLILAVSIHTSFHANAGDELPNPTATTAPTTVASVRVPRAGVTAQ